ncbi:MAG: RNA methyltransferase [Flavobacteriales bacterium]|nr:RNA methyltransferase [Flavobacteriales bacterium]
MKDRLFKILSEHLSPHKRDLFERVASNRTRYMVLVSEDIYQTQNASAILRTAECWGVQDIYVVENNHSFQVHHRIAKGSEDWLTFYRYNNEKHNTLPCIEDLRKKGYRIIVTSAEPGARHPEELDMSTPFAVFMGTELSGVSDMAIEMCDDKVHIPMYGFTESLNVSIASAILMQSLVSRIRSETTNWQLSESEQLDLKIAWARRSISWSDHIIQMFEQGEIT